MPSTTRARIVIGALTASALLAGSLSGALPASAAVADPPPTPTATPTSTATPTATPTAGPTLSPAPPSASAAASCTAEVPEVGSFDRGWSPDLAVGIPRFGGVSAIDVHYSGRNPQRLTDETLPTTRYGFGASLTAIDVNHDGCSELIASIAYANGAPSAVAIINGGPTGLVQSSLKEIESPTGDEGFGATLASARNGDLIDLWVGAPDSKVGSVVQAGAVEHYTVSARGTVTLVGRVTARSLGGTAHAFAHFGSVLSARNDGVVIGVPDDRVSGQAEAGSIWVVGRSSTGVQIARQWTQNTPGVPDKAEAHDRFGSAIAGTGTIIVGTPYEDIGSKKNTGLVTLIAASGKVRNITQNSPGIPGSNESTDRFGAAVAQGTWLNCQESADFAVGAPGEDFGKAKGAGAVTLLPSAEGCKAVYLRQGKGRALGGKAETGDHVGATLSTLRGRDDFDEDVQDSLILSAPGEDLGGAKDAGVVLVRRGRTLTSYTDSAGRHSGTDYGSVLTHPGAGPMFTD